ncbi:hypothetical protein POVWA2_044630 [Plasmodium ovale wallikeri]|uniref:DNA-directed RNA polymerase III subunit RPC5 n=1 Tax=Plasmodium ovale wallikeri TaxID=864142 RepID=A0A1A8ZG54_PLAOA|nr:hypothetical protein POVWA2_044630 [Plasmodium ovale wallikeri]
MNDDLKELSKYEYEEGSDKDSKASTSDNEEIEEEIDIYLNNVNENNLNNISTYLIQYPLRPKYRPYHFTNSVKNIYKSKTYNKLRHIKSNFNPNEETYLFEYKLHQYMKEDIHQCSTTYKDEHKDKNISRLLSTSVLCDYVTNCVCVFQYNEIKKKKEIFMIPLKRIYQFKPCYDNIKVDPNCEDKKNEKELSTPINNAKENGETTEGGNRTGENSSTNVVEDKWTHIANIYDPESGEAQEIMNLFTTLGGGNIVGNGMGIEKNEEREEGIKSSSRRDEAKQIIFNRDEGSYLDHMCRNSKEDTYNHLIHDVGKRERKYKDTVRGNNLYKNEEDIMSNLNMLYFISLNLDEQILKIMRMKNVQRFSEIQKIIKKDVDNETLLRTIRKYCVTIMGLWVIKSKYLYKFLKCKEKKTEKEKEAKKKGEIFSYIDYKIRVRDLLLVIVYKQVEPLIMKFIKDFKSGITSADMTKVHNKNGNNSQNYENNILNGSNNINPTDNPMKKINTTTSIMMENFEKATNLPNSVLVDIFSPLCEYRYTGYFFRHRMDEQFIASNINLCLFYNEKWKKKMMKVAKIIQTYKNSKMVINDFRLDIRMLEKKIIDLLHNNSIPFDDLYDSIKKEVKNINVDIQSFVQALNNIGTHINNIWFLRIENETEFNKCRNAVINMYHNNHNSILSKREIINIVETYIKSPLTIPDIYFRNILKEFCQDVIATRGEATSGEATPGEATPGEATPGEATPAEKLRQMERKPYSPHGSFFTLF